VPATNFKPLVFDEFQTGVDMFAWMRGERRLFGLISGDWAILLGGFVLVALVVVLL
jgi:hypothetical protein